MAKKQSAGDASAEAAKKRRPQKKPAAPKPVAKKSQTTQGKPGKKPGKKPREAVQGELPIAEVEVAVDVDRKGVMTAVAEGDEDRLPGAEGHFTLAGLSTEQHTDLAGLHR